jgi:hypothetical protein
MTVHAGRKTVVDWTGRAIGVPMTALSNMTDTVHVIATEKAIAKSR